MSWERIEGNPTVKTDISPLANHSASIYKEKLYIFGGDDETERVTNDLIEGHISNIADWKKIKTEKTPPPRSSHTCNIIDNNLYIYGGCGHGGVPLQDIWTYSFNNGTWEELQPRGEIPLARASHSSVVYDNRYIIIYGGWNFEKFFSDIWAYDIVDNHWTQIIASNSSKSSEIRVKHKAVILDNQMIIVGGEDGDMYLQNSVFKCTINIDGSNFQYDWESFQFDDNNFPDCYGHQIILFDDHLIAFGGYAGEFSLLNDLYILPLIIEKGEVKTSLNGWKKLFPKNKPAQRYAHSLSLLIDPQQPFAKLILFGGVTGDFQKLSNLDSLTLSFVGDPDELSALEKSNEKVEWRCPMCTFLNAGSSCMMCGFSK